MHGERLCYRAAVQQGQPHGNHEIPPAGYDPASGPIQVVEGLSWTQVQDQQTGLWWKGFYADGLLCARNPGQEHPGDFVSAQFPDNPAGFNHWSNPSEPPSQSHVPPHQPNICKWFATWSQDPAVTPVRDVTFAVTVTVTHNHNDPPTVNTYPYQVRVRIAGGPLEIAEDFRYESTATAFIMHRAITPLGGDEPDKAYPWYLPDFDYNPFHYRTAAPQYTITGLQNTTRVKSKALWTQPDGITLVRYVTGVGTFLNLNNQLSELSQGVPDPQLTKYLNPSIYTLISANGEQDTSSDFNHGGAYYVGVPSGLPLPVAVDKSGDFWKLQDERENKLYRKSENYAKFRVHKPTILVDLKSKLNTYPVPPGKVGDWFLYQVKDQYDQGMPGVWVQERFIGSLPPFGSAVPANFVTNASTGYKWVTRRGPFSPSFLKSGEDPFDDGAFDETDIMFYAPQSPDLILLHEYWAATDICVTRLADYPWRFVPNANPPVKRYLGIWMGSCDMVFTSLAVTHNLGQRHSGAGPP